MQSEKSPDWELGAQIVSRKHHIRFGFAEAKQRMHNRFTGFLQSCGVPASSLTGKHCACPIERAGEDRFRYDNKNGTGSFICTHCGSGDGFKFLGLFLRIEPKEVLQMARDYLGAGNSHTPPTAPKQPQNERRGSNLQRIWNEAVPPTRGDPVHRYFTTRKLKLPAIPSALRYHPSLGYWEGRTQTGTYPAMLAQVVAPDGTPICLHRTYLTLTGEKAPVPSVKKLMAPITPGSLMGSAIRLYPAGKILGVAEGIESALAVHVSTGLPVWGAISAGGMESIVIPQEVQEVVIFADNDDNGRGQAAANKLANRLYAEGKTVKILLPPETGTDFADLAAREAAN